MDVMSKNSIGGRIGARLGELNWMQQDLAARIGVTQPVISLYIRDVRVPPDDSLAALGNALGLSVRYLRGEEPDHSAMTSAPGELSWHERRAPDDGTRSYGNARAELFGLITPRSRASPARTQMTLLTAPKSTWNTGSAY